MTVSRFLAIPVANQCILERCMLVVGNLLVSSSVNFSHCTNFYTYILIKYNTFSLSALGALVHLYTEAINDPDAIPNVETAWDTFVITKCAEARKEAFQIYDERMTQLMSKRLPCDNEEIQKNHETAQRESMEKFELETDALISKAIREEWKKLTVSLSQ